MPVVDSFGVRKTGFGVQHTGGDLDAFKKRLSIWAVGSRSLPDFPITELFVRLESFPTEFRFDPGLLAVDIELIAQFDNSISDIRR